MLRPSVNQITSAYTGRMPALQEQVEKDKQANNGIPSDLRKLLALQDLTSDQQHMGIDQALKTPQSPPTVSQSLQDRARQILQARMVQAQQKAMMEQGRPGDVPPGVPQPDRQPEGIDQLESNVGDSYARGGIVAFTNGGSTPSSGEFSGFSGPTPEQEAKAEIRAAEEERLKKLAELEQKAEFLRSAGAPQAKEVENQLRALKADMRPKPSPTDPNFRRQTDPRLTGTSAVAPSVPLITSAPPRPRITSTTDKPSIANLPTSPAELPAPAEGSPRAILGKDMAVDPDAEMNRILAAREKLVGAPDTSQYQALIEELRGQKSKLQQKKEPGFESLMEYFNEIAAGPTVGRSGKAGAMAADRLRLRELDKEKQANALSERMIEAAQKQQDAIYGYKKEGFTLSENERAKVFDRRFQAAKAANESDDRAKQLAQQAVLEAERNATTLKASRMGRADNLMERAAAIRAENKGMSVEESIRRAALAGGATSLEGVDVRAIKDKEERLAKLEERYPLWSRTGDSKGAIAARKEFDEGVARIQAAYSGLGGAGLNSLPTALPPGVTVTKTSSK